VGHAEFRIVVAWVTWVSNMKDEINGPHCTVRL
jgi:hypothetical protein